MLNVLIKRLTIDEDAIEEHDCTATEARLQCAVHGPLECSGGSRQVKCNNLKLVMPNVSRESCFMSPPLPVPGSDDIQKGGPE
jgi:hypothetical protein